MPLIIRPATQSDFEPLQRLVIAAFEPITWQKPLDARFGSLNGCDWRARSRARLSNIFQTQIVLVGECDSRLAAMATATIDHESALGFIDVLAVGRNFQGRGLGRDVLRGMMDHLRDLGCRFVHLDCLTTNEAGNALYENEGFEEVARHIRWFRKL